MDRGEPKDNARRTDHLFDVRSVRHRRDGGLEVRPAVPNPAKDWLVLHCAEAITSADPDSVDVYVSKITESAAAEKIDLPRGLKGLGYKKLEDYILDLMDEIDDAKSR